LRKFISNVVGRPLPTATSLLSLLLLFFMLDMVWVASLSINNYFDRIIGTIEMELFLKEEVADSTAVPIVSIIENLEGVDSLRYMSKKMAREKLYSLMGTDLLDGLDANPLPISIIISFKDEYLNSDFLGRIESQLLKMPLSAEVFYPRDWLEKAELTKELTYKSALFLGGLIYLAVILNLLYAIRLSAKAALRFCCRRREISLIIVWSLSGWEC
jgi:cell division protein FtsX